MYSVVDIESTGGGFKGERIIEIAVFVFDGSEVVDSFHSLINPETKIPSFITGLTGISNKMVKDAPLFEEIAERLHDMMQGTTFVAHNVLFDYGFIKQEFKRIGKSFELPKLCTVKLAKSLLPGYESYSLGKLCKDLNITIENRHRADGDALATVELFKLIRAADKDSLIENMSQYGHGTFEYSEDFDWKIVNNLPEETGVYYFHNKKGEVIFVGRSNDIRSRVQMSLNHKPVNQKKQKIYEETLQVSYEETGSELVASLQEFIEIRSQRPVYNRGYYVKGFKYGLFHEKNEKGYWKLFIKKLERGERPVAVFEKESVAKSDLQRRVSELKLCPKLCGFGRKTGACPNYELGTCSGACIGEEKVSYYNAKVAEALEMSPFRHRNFLIIGEGRAQEEVSVVCVREDEFYGYSFFDKSELNGNPENVADLVPAMETSNEVTKILLAYLGRNHTDKIVSFKG